MTQKEKIYLHIMKRQETMLKELMDEEEFQRFTADIAKEAFRMEIDGMADSEFKEFVTENFDEITGE